CGFAIRRPRNRKRASLPPIDLFSSTRAMLRHTTLRWLLVAAPALFGGGLLWLGSGVAPHAGGPAKAPPPQVAPRSARGRLKGDDEAWKHAQVIDHFYLPWLGDKARPAKTKTKAKLLWDREYLYFFADMEDTDLYADVTEYDGETWDNDVFELFFKPADDKPG